MYMKFIQGDIEITIYGNPYLSCTPVSLNSLLKIADVDYLDLLWVLKSLDSIQILKMIFQSNNIFNWKNYSMNSKLFSLLPLLYLFQDTMIIPSLLKLDRALLE